MLPLTVLLTSLILLLLILAFKDIFLAYAFIRDLSTITVDYILLAILVMSGLTKLSHGFSLSQLVQGFVNQAYVLLLWQDSERVNSWIKDVGNIIPVDFLITLKVLVMVSVKATVHSSGALIFWVVFAGPVMDAPRGSLCSGLITVFIRFALHKLGKAFLLVTIFDVTIVIHYFTLLLATLLLEVLSNSSNIF